MYQKNKGILLIITSAFFFALMNAMVRMAGDLPSIEKSFFRNFIAVMVAFVAIKKQHIPVRVARTDIAPLLSRSIAGTLGILCNFYAIDHLQLADASILNKLSPFFAIVFSILLLKEKVSPFQISCVLTAFIGSIFIIKPGIGAVSSLPALVGMLGGLGAGIAYTFVRILGSRGVKGPLIVFCFSAFSCLVTLPYLIFCYVPMSGRQLVFLLLAGIFASGGQFTITAAYTYAPAKEISIYDYSQILFSTLLGFFLFSQIPDFLSWIGYFVIILASLAMFIYNKKRA